MKRTLHVERSVEIDRPPELVRRQFADVAHHERTAPHRGVRFDVLDDDAGVCRYRQTTRVGPLRLCQEMELVHSVEGPLVNRIVAGSLSGGEILFDVEAMPGRPNTARVTATVHAELSGVEAFARPILERRVGSALAVALEEDRADLESGNYD